MNVRNRLLTIVEANPSDASIILPILRIQAWLDEDRIDDSRPQLATDQVADYTVLALAEIFGKRPNTVREWIRCGELEAYLFQGREYRVTRNALDQFMASQRKNCPPTKASSHVPMRDPAVSNAPKKGGRRKLSNTSIDLGSWKEVYRRAS